MAVSRFNLSRLRGLTSVQLEPQDAEVNIAPFPRRSLLGIWGGVALGSGPAFPGFRIVREGHSIHILTGEQQRLEHRSREVFGTKSGRRRGSGSRCHHPTD